MNNLRLWLEKIGIFVVFILVVFMGVSNLLRSKSAQTQIQSPSVVNSELTQKNMATTSHNIPKGLSMIVLGENKKDMTNVAGIDTVLSMASGADFSVIAQTDGSVLTWGSNDSAQLGRKTSSASDMMPTKVEELKDIVQVSATHKHTLALDKYGNVFAFGSNFTGQIGNDSNVNVYTPIQINIKNIKKVAAGHKFSMAVDNKGDVYAWGAFCNKETQAQALALLNSFGSNITSLEGGYYDASSVGEGAYNHAEDCLNEATVGIKSRVPKKIATVKDMVDISVGYGHALLLKKDGTVWSFGCNMYGQLGWGQFDNITDNATPRKIEGLKNIKKISAGFRSSLAVDDENNIFYWGINAKIDTKNQNTFNQPTPEKLHVQQVFKKIDAISSGRDYTLIALDGVVYSFGNDYLNILNSKEKSFGFYPKKVEFSNNKNIKEVIAGGSYATVLLSK